MVEEGFNQKSPQNADPEYESILSIQAFLVFLLAVFFGLVVAAYVLPIWLPGLTSSFIGSSPKAYWYLSRATGFVALGMLWASMMLGIGVTNKMARLWPGVPPAMAIHEYTGLLGLFFGGFHALILLGDKYSKYTLAQLLMPFGSVQYRPTWVALGQLCFYAWFIIAVTFYIRRAIGKKTWRVIHYASFVCYLAALIHGLTSGTDTAALWAQDFYWLTGGSLLFLLIYRILTSRKTVRPQAASPAPGRQGPVREGTNAATASQGSLGSSQSTMGRSPDVIQEPVSINRP
jgi:predicted ferric reductase